MTTVGRRLAQLHPAWVGLVGVALYLRSAWYGLLPYDDPWLIGQNQLLHGFTWDAIRAVLFDLSFERRFQLGAEYLPLRDLSVMTDFAIWGERFGGHHLTQVLLYGGLCAFAAAFTLGMFAHRGLAWWVGLAFAVHPVHVESVAWLSERKGVLGGLLVFSACWLAIRYLEAGGLLRLAGVLILYAGSVLSKGHMLAGAGALAMCSLWVARVEPRRRIALALGAAIVGAVAFVPVYAAGRSMGMVQPYHGGGLIDTANLFFEAHGKYLQLMALGGPYSITYPIGTEYPSPWLRAIGLGSLVVCLALAIGALVRPSWRNAATFGLAWWLVFLAPVSQILFPLQNLLADRYLLVGSWGLLLILGAGLFRLPARSRWSLGAIWIAASLAWSWTQVGHWASSADLRRQAVAVHPGHVKSWQSLAAGAREQGRLDEAWGYTERGLVVAPGHWRLFHERGLIRHAQGRTQDAIDWMRKAASQPESHKAYANLGLLLLRQGRVAEALAQVRQAVEHQPHSAHNQRSLGIVALEAGEMDEACDAFFAARRLEPYNGANHFNVGLCEWTRGRPEAAGTAFDEAIELSPGLSPRIEEILEGRSGAESTKTMR